MKTLETARLILRPFREEDLDDLYAYAKNPNVGPNAGWKPHENVDESRTILRRFMDEDENWAVVERETGRVIGSFGLAADRKRCFHGARMIGYALAEDQWGKGLMTEAVARVLGHCFDELALSIVSVWHSASNRRSRRVIEKSGFTYEGTLRRADERDGVYIDHVCYSITREEYRALVHKE